MFIGMIFRLYVMYLLQRIWKESNDPTTEDVLLLKITRHGLNSSSNVDQNKIDFLSMKCEILELEFRRNQK